MKSLAKSSLRWLAVLGVVALLASAETPSANVPRGVVAGRVVDAAGRPLKGVRVWIKDVGNYPRKVVAEGRTDDEGEFHIESPAARVATIFAEAEGYAVEYRPEQPLFPHATVTLPDIVLHPGRDVTGRVLDPEGKPVAGLELTASLQKHMLGHTIEDIIPDFRLTTDADGRFLVRHVPPCTLDAFARVTGYEMVEFGERIPAGTGTFEFPDVRLTADAPIVGTVKDKSGQPLAGIKVETNHWGERTTVTDTDGRFELRGFSADTRPILRIDVPNYVHYDKQIPENRAPVEVELKPCTYFNGIVIDAETGMPIRFDSLTLCFAELDATGKIVTRGCLAINAEQNELGQFRVGCDDDENYCLTVAAKGYVEGKLFFDKLTRRAKADNLQVKLHRIEGGPAAGQRITGVVRDGNRPIKSAWVSLQMPPKSADSVNAAIKRGRVVPDCRWWYAPASMLSADDGTFALTVPEPGPWYVTVEEATGRKTILGPLDIKASEQRALEIAVVEGGTIVGRVNHIPSDWRGQLWVVAFDGTVSRAETRVAADGSFRFDNLPPGDYGLKAGHDSYADPDVPRTAKGFTSLPKEAWETPADPWKSAVKVHVAAGQKVRDVAIECPAK